MLTKTETTKPKVVNGINVDDLFALIDGVKGDAAKGKTHWRVRSAWQDQTRSRAHIDGLTIGGQYVPRQFSFDIDEPCEIGGSNRFANPQEHLLAALNACMMVGYVAQCAVRGITLEKLEIETDGEIDLRGFLGIDSAVPPGYKNLSYVVRIKGNGTREQFAEIHKAVMATSPNFHNVSRPVDLKPTLFVESLAQAPVTVDPTPGPESFIPPQPERAAVVRPPRMPRIEDLPIPAQAQLAAQRGEAPQAAPPTSDKKRMTLLQRLAAVGLGRRDGPWL